MEIAQRGLSSRRSLFMRDKSVSELEVVMFCTVALSLDVFSILPGVYLCHLLANRRMVTKMMFHFP